MKLNKGESVNIDMNNKNNIKFADGTAMPREEEATYLGANITKKKLNRKEVDETIGKAF